MSSHGKLYAAMDWLHLILYDGRIARRLVLPEPSGAVWYSFLNLCMDMCHFAPRLPGCGFFFALMRCREQKKGH